MKTLIVMMLMLVSIASAHACELPIVGDQVDYFDGPLMEVVKVFPTHSGALCEVKMHLCTITGRYKCRWEIWPNDSFDKRAKWNIEYKD